jgi:hypothetical protein
MDHVLKFGPNDTLWEVMKTDMEYGGSGVIGVTDIGRGIVSSYETLSISEKCVRLRLIPESLPDFVF